MNGFETLQILQSFTNTRDIPVIALSASAIPADIDKGIKASFQNYITKLLAVEDMLYAIKEIIDQNIDLEYKSA
ncbi:MAG: hypothetical protein QGG84_05295 [Rhodospirillales bacterium]|nr:hypothetical protein [Rhodospirillales bacterium]